MENKPSLDPNSFKQMVEHLVAEGEDIGYILSYLSILENRTGGLDCDSFKQLIEHLTAGGEDVGYIFSYFSNLALQQYKSSGIESALIDAIEKAELAVQFTPDGYPERASRLNNLGVMFSRRYERTGQMQDLEKAIQLAQLAVNSSPHGHPDRTLWLSNLGYRLEKRYERTDQIDDLEEAIRLTQLTVDSTPRDYPHRAGSLSNLGNQLARRYERTGQMRDLEEAIRLTQLAVDSTPCDHPDRAPWLNNLGVKFQKRYERTGQMSDLKEAIRLTQLAVDSTPLDHPDRAPRLINLGNQFAKRYERTGQTQDLEEAIQLTQLAVASTPLDHPHQTGYSNNLGNQLEKRYERKGQMQDLEEAIRVTQLAVDSIPSDHPDRALLLDNLGNKLERRYERMGQIQDLEGAIQLAQLAIDSSPPDRLDRPLWLNNLGEKLQRRYERTGQMQDLEEAIRLTQVAVDSTPHDHPERSARLSNLGEKLERRYERTGQMQDIEEAIRVTQLAVDLTPADHPRRAVCINNLGNKLGTRYKRTGQIEDLEEAVRLAQLAVDSIPLDHPGRVLSLNNLSVELGNRYESTGQIQDLEEAIRIAQLGINSTPLDHQLRAKLLNNLGVNLQRRYESTDQIGDLEEAIRVAQLVVDSIPHDHPDRAGSLNNLGSKLERQYERTGQKQDLEDACTHYLQAWNCQLAIPFIRINASGRALQLLLAQGNFGRAAELARDIVDLLPTVNARFLDRIDRQFVMSIFSGIAASVCALLLEVQEPDQALQYLERSRAVILSQLMDERSDISRLMEDYPERARAYESLRDEMNTVPRGLEDDSTRMHVLNRRRTTAAELDSCIREIRSLPGYDRFLLGQTTAEMQACAVEGSIIVVNVTNLRSDAIIVSHTAIKTLRLPGLSASKVESWLRKKWTGGKSERGKRNQEFLVYLSWLWEVCVKQILEEIGAGPRQLEELPRIWWIGIGLASSMPFHAAGKYCKNSTENAFCRAISSYTPSIRVLAHSRDRARDTEAEQARLMIATMTTTPDLIDLPGVTLEKDRILDSASGFLVTENLDQPGARQVIESLTRCNIAHLACHGYTNHIDPSESGLVFQKCEGSKEPKQDILTVHSISEANLKHARIAYLSACSTAENRVAQLADETIHMVSGFQVAGFAHVIGCLWPSVDRVCAEVARSFYLSLCCRGRIRWGNKEVAAALHKAIVEIRASDFKQPLNWAQFVHYGA